MKLSTGALALNAAINMAEQKRILNFINSHPEKQGELAKKEYKRFNLITILIIFLVVFPLFTLGTLFLTNSFDNPEYPNGATQEISGRISLYEDTFWYTDSSQAYEFAFEDYNIDDSFEPGENILIYLDDNNNIVSVAHKTKDYGLLIFIILSYVIPIVLLLSHAFVGRKTYAKNWTLYAQWYRQEIEPYRFQPNFEEIIANKQYYDVTVNINDLSEDNQRLYKKYRNRNILYSLLLVVCIGLTIYFCIKFDLTLHNWLVMGIMIIYVMVFYILINKCDEKMKTIKKSYNDKEEKRQ